MIAHGRDDCSVGCTFEFLGQDCCEVDVVRLGLGPNIVSRVVSRPYNKVKI